MSLQYSQRSHFTPCFLYMMWQQFLWAYFLWGLLRQLFCKPNRSFWSMSSLASIEWWHHESMSKVMLEEGHSSPKWGHSSHSILCTSLSSHWCYCIEEVNTERVYILGMQYLALVFKRRYSLCYKVLNGTFNMTRKWIIVHIILQMMSKLHLVSSPRSTVLTVKRVIGGQYSQVIPRISQ